MQDYERMVLDLINISQRQTLAKALVLGGAPSVSGGAGGPPGGFVGYLPQKRVAYDMSEIASSGIPISGASLYDNLNHIRYRINVLESGYGGHEIVSESGPLPQRRKLKFLGNVTVVDDYINNTTQITVLSGTSFSGVVTDSTLSGLGTAVSPLRVVTSGITFSGVVTDSTLTGIGTALRPLHVVQSGLTSQVSPSLFGRAVGSGTGIPTVLTARQGMDILATDFGQYSGTNHTLSLFGTYPSGYKTLYPFTFSLVPDSSNSMYFDMFCWSENFGFEGLYANGTKASPLAVNLGDAIFEFNGLGYDGSSYTRGARIRFLAAEDFSVGHSRTDIDFEDGAGTSLFKVSVSGVNIPTGSTYKINGTAHNHVEDKTVAETNANDIFRVDNPGGTSAFVGTIATKSTTTLTYNVTSGTEGAMVPQATTLLAKMRLYNTTRGTSALISNCDIATNTITLTANVPAGWTVGDTITIASQTVSGGSLDWVDLEITSGPTGKTALFIKVAIQGATVGHSLRLHPFTASFSTAKYISAEVLVSNQTTRVFDLLSLSSNVFSMAWTGTPAVITLRESGYIP